MAEEDVQPDPQQPPEGEYVVVARRYRPRTFEQLVGQEHVAKALAGAIEANRVGHAYLFTGARGVGKTSAARILAKALDCEHGPTPTPCDQCDICTSISTGDDVDVLEIDGASNRGIDEIRQLRSNVNIRPSRARFKIYIIDEVHMLTREAFNALLKTLEEPPEHVKFIFCTTEPNKIPITVLSRCQRYDFAGIQSDAIVDRLAQIVAAEGMSADNDALQLLARRAAGSMRDSQSLLEQLMAFGTEKITVADVHEMLGTADSARLLEMAEQIAAGDAAAALGVLDEALGEGVDVGQLLEQLVGVFRDGMVALAGCGNEAFLNTIASDEQVQVRQIADQLGLETTLAVLGVLEQAVTSLRYTTHRRTVAEIALVRCCKLEGLDELASLVAQLRDGSINVPSPRTTVTVRRDDVDVKRPKRAVDISGELDTPSGDSKSPPKKKSEPAADRPVTAGRQPALAAKSPPASPTTPSSPEPEMQPNVEAEEEKVQHQPTQHLLLSEANAKEIWERACAKLPGTLAEIARNYDSLAIPAPNRLAVCFNQTYNFHKSRCESPEQTERIRRALEEVTGAYVQVVFTLSEQPSDAPAERPATSRQQKISAIAENPMVRKARDLFGARPVEFD